MRFNEVIKRLDTLESYSSNIEANSMHNAKRIHALQAELNDFRSETHETTENLNQKIDLEIFSRIDTDPDF